MGNPNVFAGYLELSTPFALGLALYHGNRKVRLLALAATVIGVLSTLYTFSRGGLISVVIGCGLVLFYRFRRQLWIPAVVLAVFVIFLGATAGIFERQVELFTKPMETITQPTLLHRYFGYRSILREFIDSPLFGEGWGARPFFWGRTKLYSFWEIRHTVSEVPLNAFGGLNNLYLTFLVRGGLLGGTALIAMLAMVGVTCFRAIRHAPRAWGIGIAAGMVAFLIHQTMDNFLQWHFVAPFFWIHLGLATAATAVEERDSLERESNTRIRGRGPT
jgi:O-antigen ligase